MRLAAWCRLLLVLLAVLVVSVASRQVAQAMHPSEEGGAPTVLVKTTHPLPLVVPRDISPEQLQQQVREGLATASSMGWRIPESEVRRLYNAGVRADTVHGQDTPRRSGYD